MFACEPQQQVRIERLGEARVRDRGRQAERCQFVGGLQAFPQPRAVRQQRHLVAFAHDAALADLERHAFGRQRHAEAFAARITQRRGRVVDRDLRRHHVHQFGFVGRRHQHETGQAAKVGDVEGAGMGRAVGADQPGAVDGEAHRQLLDGDVVHHLVVAALQEGRIDRRERLEALRGEAGREGHCVLLGDADIEGALGELLLELVEPGAGRHRRGDGDDPVVLARFFDQRVAEHLGVLRRAAFGLRLRAGRDVELDHAVVLVGGSLGRGVAFALLRHDVNEDRPDLGVAHVAQHRQQVIEIVAVDRPDVIEAELLEQRAASDVTARVLDGAGDGAVPALRQMMRELLADVAQLEIGAAGA